MSTDPKTAPAVSASPLSAATTAGVSPLALPQSLRHLVAVVEQLAATSPPPAQLDNPAEITAAIAAPSSEPYVSVASSGASSTNVASTRELLNLVRCIRQRYAVLLELAEEAYATRKRHSTAPISAVAAGDDVLARQADRCMTELENTVVALQNGVRSKLAQSSRLVLLNSLRREVAERRQCVAKMEGVLAVARQHVRL